jgi:5-methylcytosine-specific restriction enzyme subunit McrC
VNAVATLDEYDAISVHLSDDVAHRLATAAKNALRVTIDDAPGRYRIEAAQYVGSIVVPGATVLIRPKVPLRNVFLLLEAVSEPSWRQEEFDWDASDGLLPAFAAFFARTLENTLGLGLYRTYRREEEWLPSIRGRLDFAAQLRRPGMALPAPCNFDEFTADVIENQILKAALLRLSRVAGLHAQTHARLRRLRTFFDEVSDVLVAPDAVDRIHFHRLNERYRTPLRLAQLVLRNLTLADQRGVRAASSFLIDMNELFQAFVAQRLQKLLRRRLTVTTEPPVPLAQGRKVRMYPDLVFERHGGHIVFVGDTKYKLLGDQLGRNSDYYQMLAYTTALDVPEGVLIYASASGLLPDRCIDVRNSNKRLWTYPLDLAGSPEDVQQSLDALAHWIAERASDSSALMAAG